MNIETIDEKCKRWFYNGMNDKERIVYLLWKWDQLLEQIKQLKKKEKE